ncbi:TVP38/TMEM64 family protein [Butyrivibrio sp. XPD2006]|uniref:TVP38/TMEM64 family protein n=1 Tax=Butyrivibrio sp. XPD2006 TaxID=1280668 RepID=UPI0003B589F7|nr:hypothetical protein [Butyrivibrio sp. XPD2006]
MKNSKFKILPICILLGFLVCIYVFIGRPMIAFVSDIESFKSYIDSKGIAGILTFGALVFFQTFSTCIPGLPFYLAAGAVWGGLKAALICDLFASLANTLAFIFSEKIGRKVLCYLCPEDKIEYVEKLAEGHNPVLTHIIFMFLPLPKDNYAWLGYYTKESISKWFIITFTMRFAQIFIYTLGAEKAVNNQYGLIAAGWVFAVLVYVGAFIYLRKKKNG